VLVVELKPIAEWNLGTAPTAMDFIRHETHDNVLVIADPGGVIRLYDATIGQEIEPAQPEKARYGASAVYSMAYLPQHGGWPKLVTVGGSSTVFEYDVSKSVADPEYTHPVDGVRLHIVDALQRPNGTSVIAAGGRGGDVHLLFGATGGRWTTLPEHERAVHALKVLRREYWLVVAHEGSLTTWDLSLEEPKRRNAFGPGDIRSMACYYDASGRARVASAPEHGVQIWDPEAGRLITSFARRSKVAAITSVNVGSGDPLLAVASDNKVVLWNPTTELVDDLQLMCVHQGRIRSLAKILAGSGRTLLAAADDDGHVAVWQMPLAREAATVLRGHRGWINGLVALNGTQSGSDSLLASASDDATVRVWRSTGPDGPPLPHRVQVQAIAKVRPNVVATGDEEGVIRLWRLNDRAQPKAELKLPDGRHRIRAMATYTGSDGVVRIVSVGSHPNPVIWNIGSESVEGELLSGEEDRVRLIRSVAAGRVGGTTLVAAGDSAGQIKIWDVSNPVKHQAPPQPHPLVQVRALAIVETPEGALLAAGGDDGVIRLWELSERSTRRGANGPFIIRACEHVIHAHKGQIGALTVIDDGNGVRLASGGADGCIRTWDPLSGERVTELPNAHDNWVRTIIQLTPAGSATRLASGGDDGSIRLWDLVEGQLIRSRHDVNIRGFGDRPAQSDLLSRQDIVEVLTDLLRPPDTDPGTVADTDLPLRRTTGPQVVTVEGAWGSGKTSLMWKLRRGLDPSLPAPEAYDTASRLTPRLAYRILKHGTLSRRWGRAAATEPEAQGPIDRVITAWFNPWAHQSSEQVWAGLAATIIDATRRALGATSKEQQAYWLTANLDRLDRAAVRRAIRLRVWRPTLAAIAALMVPVTVSLLGRPSLLNWLNIAVLLTAGLTLSALTAYAAYQWCRASVAAYLPEALLDGPLPPGALTPIPGTDPLMRDSFYYARSGQLHQTQRDVYELVKNLERRGYQLVVFIDDLDRCPARTTTEVFEAINGFLAEQYSSAHQGLRHLVCRFVVGLDATVVANRLAEAYPGVSAQSTVSPDDPNAGWAVLRKLSQLSVMLPTIREAHTTRLLKRHTPEPLLHDSPEVATVSAPSTEPADGLRAPERMLNVFAERVRAWIRPAAAPRPEPEETEAAEVKVAGNREQIIPLEGDPTLRDHLRQLVALRPRQSMRETKRLLTLWGYYVRLLGMRLPLNATATAQGARDVLTLAEIASRWPALMPALAQVHQGQSGLRLLISAVHSADEAQASWESALKQAGLSDPQYQGACENLRKLLGAYGSKDLVEFADSLL
jgi:WD40 repeat protein